MTLAVPAPLTGAPLSAGTMRGGDEGAEVSFDGGKRWLPFGRRPVPIVEGVQVRTAAGTSHLDFIDGSRINVLPFSRVRFRPPSDGPRTGIVEVVLDYGRISFRFPATGQIAVVTPSAHLEPIRAEVMAGELFVDQNGTTGLKLQQGAMQVRELVGARRTLVSGRAPLFVPQKPDAPGPLFSSDVTAPTSTDAARPVFNPQGENIGYLNANGQFVYYPGYAANLMRPFGPETVKSGVAKIPEGARGDAIPLFDVAGDYVGYVAGPIFYAATPFTPAPALAAPPPSVMTPPAGVTGAASGAEAVQAAGGGRSFLHTAGFVVLVVGGVGIAVAAGGGGGGGGDAPATPTAP